MFSIEVHSETGSRIFAGSRCRIHTSRRVDDPHVHTDWTQADSEDFICGVIKDRLGGEVVLKFDKFC